MSKQDDGGPAYPCVEETGETTEHVDLDMRTITTEPVYRRHNGMTLRDWFAGQAMQAMLTAFTNTGESGDPESTVLGFFNREGAIDTNHKTGEHDGATEIAHDAYTIADAMLAARKETT